MSPKLKPEHWVPVTVFLAVALPLVWLLEVAGVAAEHRVWLAIGAGAVATGLAQSRLARNAAPREGEPS